MDVRHVRMRSGRVVIGRKRLAIAAPEMEDGGFGGSGFRPLGARPWGGAHIRSPDAFRPVILRLPFLALALAAVLAGCATTRPASAPAREVTVLVYNIHAGKDAAG